jgi:hypothetical protein
MFTSIICVSANVVSWDIEDSNLMEDLKMTIGQYLEHVRNRLLARSLVFDDDLGLVSI